MCMIHEGLGFRVDHYPTFSLAICCAAASLVAVAPQIEQAYSADDIAALFDDLRAEAHLALLFLKSVQSLELFELPVGSTEPVLLFSCSIANATPSLLQERALFLRASTAPPDKDVAGCFQLAITSADMALRPVCTAKAGAPPLTPSKVTRTRTYLISQRRGPRALLDRATELSRRLQAPLVAWGAVAALVLDDGTGAAGTGAVGGARHQHAQGVCSDASSHCSSRSEECKDHNDTGYGGRAFCFLPLPTFTGLPLHVNGYFELSSNRRDVWHGTDMAGVGRLRAQWNEALLQLVVAPAYVELLAHAAQLLGPGHAFARCVALTHSAVRHPSVVELATRMCFGSGLRFGGSAACAWRACARMRMHACNHAGIQAPLRVCACVIPTPCLFYGMSRAR
jgi:sacsin